jgi:hypothetical protein
VLRSTSRVAGSTTAAVPVLGFVAATTGGPAGAAAGIAPVGSTAGGVAGKVPVTAAVASAEELAGVRVPWADGLPARAGPGACNGAELLDTAGPAYTTLGGRPPTGAEAGCFSPSTCPRTAVAALAKLWLFPLNGSICQRPMETAVPKPTRSRRDVTAPRILARKDDRDVGLLGMLRFAVTGRACQSR